jgi:hypothetical protein
VNKRKMSGLFKSIKFCLMNIYVKLLKIRRGRMPSIPTFTTFQKINFQKHLDY